MKKEIFIIDDSALMRRVLSDIIELDDRFKVFGVAINGLDALSVMQRDSDKIDAILLDINMPRMNGMEFLKELKEQNIQTTIIIVSSIAQAEANETILALELGAFDFVRKPESFYKVKSKVFASKILDTLSAALKLKDKSKADANSDRDKKYTSTKKHTKLKALSSKKLVVIACSTGGPKALNLLIPKLPRELDASVLIVQHMPEGFTKSLADRLNDISILRVKEAEDNEVIEPGTVYIAKGGYQLRLYKKNTGKHYLSVNKEAPRHGLLPCADILYESLLNVDFDEIICVVMTGMGGDGTEGIRQLREKKNTYVIAQNEETCVVYGMPKVIKDAGLVDEETALGDIANAIINNVGVH